MKKCPQCAAEVPELQTTCPACGSSVKDLAAETEVLPADPQANTPTRLENTSKRNETPINTAGSAGRFVAGTVLAGRYRIVGLIGKGGMGEVYKADDLELEQAVALKFLPEDLARDEELLKRFRGEVRNARQVSHANVCRVFDIGETEGLYYITMEYIDGDDLSMLLKRIGRLPSDKAIEVSRRICLGLGAIHKAGILHRDLKPSNIIIDSNGEARITDFGIAGLEMEVQGIEARVGTPAYMSPEQIDGKEVTQQSDIYSLGLLLYEIFTGKQAFIADNVIDLIRKQQTETPTNPSDIVRGIDPLVESVINQCLEKNPKDRPQSALHVAMALPGGNPLQIALDAGQTPSPEMVAAAPKKGTLRPIVAFSLLITVFLGVGLLTALTNKLSLQHFVPLDKSPDVLRERSRELVEKFGYPSFDSYYTFEIFDKYINHLKEDDQSLERLKKLAGGQPAVLQFLYRTSLRPIAPLAGGKPTFSDPPNVIAGMTRIRVDTKGRMTYFEAVPSRVKEADEPLGEFDWATVFREAGLDLATFQPVAAQRTPLQAFDEQRAFSGVYPAQPDISIRVEAAAYRGKLTSFEIVDPWSPSADQAAPLLEGGIVGTLLVIFVFLVVLVGSLWLALRNISAGRSDLKNAFRVALLLFSARIVEWAFTIHHVASIDEFKLFLSGLAYSLAEAVMAGLMYLAFEPYLRKIAPERVIAWNRLLAGDWRDPLVGRDVLIGAAGYGLSLIIMLVFTYLIPIWQGKPPSISWDDPAYLSGINIFPAILAGGISISLLQSFLFAFLILFFGLLLRRKWLGAIVVWLLSLVALAVGTEGRLLEMVGVIISNTILIFIVTRFGVLATLSLFFVSLLVRVPFAADLTTWYAGNFILVVVIIVALSSYGFYTSIAGQKLWQARVFEESWDER